MNLSLINRAFEEGVKAALKFFQGPGGHQTLTKGAETVMRNMDKAVKTAKQTRK